jgi:peptide deformylase
MAIRNIVKKGDETLRKKSKEVKEINEKILELLDDMKETMYACGNGIGLAAPQVGILKRIVTIDVGDGLMELINPVILEKEGEQVCVEGCLSIPGVWGEVKRPARVVVEYTDRTGKRVRKECRDILAVCVCHEVDHLDGILFEDKVIRFVKPDEVEA